MIPEGHFNTFNPDLLPSLNVPIERSNNPSRSGRIDAKTETRLIRFAPISSPKIIFNSGGEIPPQYASSISVPVEVTSETDVTRTFKSIGEAASKLETPSLVLAYLNFKGENRREGNALGKAAQKVTEMTGQVKEALLEHNVQLLVTEAYLPAHGTSSFSYIRANMLEANLGYLGRRTNVDPYKWKHIHNTIPLILKSMLTQRLVREQLSWHPQYLKGTWLFSYKGTSTIQEVLWINLWMK